MENWTVFDTDNGLVNNFVQAIATEPFGNNVWFGTKGGVSVFDGSNWTSYTVKDGLISNNILSIMIDKNGVVYLCTDNGIMTYNFGVLSCFQ
jgi:ligand-binding sensor domain-containing protein